MTVITGAAIVLEQATQESNIASQLSLMATQINNIANQENPDADINDRIKALIASVDVQIIALNSQSVLLQQAVDTLVGLL